MGRFHRHDDGTVHSHDGDHGDHGHGDHSGYQTATQRVDVLEAIFSENDVRAADNREAFARNGIRAVNMMSSPGSGKTAVLAATLDELAGDVAVGIVEGTSPPTWTPRACPVAARRSHFSTPTTGSGASATSTHRW